MDLTHSLQAALVIEHQALAQSHIKYSLLNLGFKTIEFADRATMAIKALHKSHFDLILCAYDLNRGADGYQLFERIIEEGLLKSTTAFVFMSSENDLPLSQSIIELKPDDFILKPFTAKELELRLKRILSKKLTLRPVFEAIDDDEFDAALNLLNEQLAKNAKPKWVPYLLKLKGELITAKQDWHDAEVFYQKVLSIKEYAWANIGLVNSLLNQNKVKLAEDKLKYLVTNPATRLAALDILTKICKNKFDFEEAINHLKNAATIAPRNVNRQQDVISLARITHDFETQFNASNKIVEYIKNSVHDTPDAYLGAVRSTIDYGLTSLNDDEIKSLAQTGESILRQLKKQFPDTPLNDQIRVAKARIYNMSNDKENAKKLIQENMEDENYLVDDLEDALDKAKAFHELGFHANSEKLFELIATECKTQSKDEVFNQYIDKEKQLRIEIKESPKVLNNKAVQLYTRGNYQAALNAFLSAFKVMPKNPSISLNLLQTVVDCNYQESHPEEADEIVTKCLKNLNATDLNKEQISRLEVYLEKLKKPD